MARSTSSIRKAEGAAIKALLADGTAKKHRRGAIHDATRSVDRPPEPEPTVPALFRVSPEGDLEFFFHQGQQRVWDSVARFILMLAGSQGGKTSFGPWWLLREILSRGQGDYLAATTNFELFSKKMLPEMLRTFVDVMRIGKYWPSLRTIELCDPSGVFWARRQDDPMWGRIMLHSAEADSGLEASTAKAAWLDEVGQDGWDILHWEAILRRLALNQGRALGTTTVYNMGWLKTEWYDRWAMGDKTYDVIQFDSTDNPAFPLEEFERARKTMPTWRFMMFYRGMFEHPEHLIYGSFRDEAGENGHMVDDFAVPSDWTRVIGVDFGGANHCEIELARDPGTQVWYAIRESLGGGRTVPEMARGNLERYARMASFTYVGGAKGESQNRRDFQAAGLPIQEPPLEDVELGIDRVVQMIKEDKLRVFRSLVGTRHELRSYRRKLDDTTSLPTDDIFSKHTFHRMDALRYAAVYIVERLWGGKSLSEQIARYAGGAKPPDNTHVPTPKEVVEAAEASSPTIPSFTTMRL